MALLLETNLRLIDGKLGELEHVPFFHQNLRSFVNELRQVTQTTLDDLLHREPDVAEKIAQSAWTATQYLSGSNTNLIPYEVVHCLGLAMKEWTKPGDDFLITTSITQDRNFYFQSIPREFWSLSEEFAQTKFTHKLVQIELPELYRQRPLFILPLYHELGHFIDWLYSIAENILLFYEFDNHSLPDLSSAPPGWSDREFDAAQKSHAKEYFADLFAACYLGDSIHDYLEEFVPNAAFNETHPATYNRLQNIRSLLDGNTNVQLLETCGHVLKARNLPKLGLRYRHIDLSKSFAQMRPHNVSSDAELHGLIESGWQFVKNLPDNPELPWHNVPSHDAERIVNDLTEKSIRNHMLKTRWQDAAIDED